MAHDNQSPTKGRRPVVFDMTNQQCLWSQIGAVHPRLCHNAFDCLSCSFDQAMQRKKQAPAQGWSRERWARTPGQENYCRHMLTGRVPYKICIRGYECSNCSFDQMIEEETLYNPGHEIKLGSAAGFDFALNYYYHRAHVWARVEYGGRVRVGLDDFAARLFGPADGFELPEIGARVELGGSGPAFWRDGHQARLVNPFTGIVVARNPCVLASGADVVNSPYDHGWLLLLEPLKLQRDMSGLLGDEQVPPWLGREFQRLSDHLNAETGQRTAATGGQVVPDVYGAMPGLDWDRLVDNFLRIP